MIDMDTLIFVGFTNPREEDGGGRTLTRIMNATGVEKDNIYFYSTEQTNPLTIIRESFIHDKSEKFNYRIGKAMCIASESLKTKRKEVEQVGRVGIQVRTGYQHVNLSDLSESEIATWVETGKYVPDVDESLQDDSSGSPEDLLSDILGGDLDDTQEEDHTEQAEDTSQPEQEEQKSSHSVLDEIDALDDAVTKGHNQDDQPESQPEEEIIYDAEIVPSDEEKLTGTGSASQNEKPGSELDDILSGLDGGTSSANYVHDDSSSSTYQGISPEKMGVEDPTVKEDDDPGYSSTFQHDNGHKNITTDDLRDTEEYRKSKGIEKPSPMGDDSMEIINQLSNRRKESMEREEKERRKKAQEDREDSSPLSQLEAMVGSKSRAQKIDQDDRKTHKLDAQSRNSSEDNRREDGSRKSYREYLTERGQVEQKAAENVRDKFGNPEEYNSGAIHSEKGEDNTYVTKGVGRVILCTAGKGGVGKTLVSIGMASSLSLARSHEARENPGYTPGRTWLIESDYNSPKLAAAFGTGKKHIGNLAAMLDNSSDATLGNEKVRKCIEDNIYRDPETGVNVLACPPLSIGATNPTIPLAILTAINYASRQGDDVIVDHGNLTVGEYSSLDKLLAKGTAHRVVVVGNMGCIDQTRTALDVLASSTPGVSEKPRNPHSISVVLNKSRSEQYYLAQDKLKPFRIISFIPPIDALREENSSTGNTYLNNAPKEVKKAIYDRCGIMLVRLGFSSLQNYFVAKPTYSASKKRGKKNIFRKVAEKIAGDR